jgi:hypothetical protein
MMYTSPSRAEGRITMLERARRLGSLTVWLGVVAACVCSVSPARADGTASPAAKPNVVLPTVLIQERVPRPLAAVMISRVTTQKAIPLRPFSPLGRIEGATRKSPF